MKEYSIKFIGGSYDKYLTYRSNLKKHFERNFSIDDLLSFEVEEFATVSITGKVSVINLEIYNFCNKNNYDFIKIKIFNIKENHYIDIIEKNSYLFWSSLVSHDNGNDYFITSEDIQGFSLYNISKRRVIKYYPDEAYKGLAFSWKYVYPSPNAKYLAVFGSYLDSDLILYIYDFNKPEKIPYNIKKIYYFIEDFDDIRWINDESLETDIIEYYDKKDRKVNTSELDNESLKELVSKKILICKKKKIRYII